VVTLGYNGYLTVCWSLGRNLTDTADQKTDYWPRTLSGLLVERRCNARRASPDLRTRWL